MTVQGISRQSRVGFQHDEGFWHLAETLMRTGNNCNFEHRGVRIDRAFDLEAGYIFPTRYDDVLRAVFNFHIAIRMDHCKIAGMEPAATKCMLSCFRIAVVAFHDRIPSNDDFADLLAVRFDVAHVLAHHALLCHQIAHTLTCLQCSLLFKR